MHGTNVSSTHDPASSLFALLIEKQYIHFVSHGNQCMYVQPQARPSTQKPVLAPNDMTLACSEAYVNKEAFNDHEKKALNSGANLDDQHRLMPELRVERQYQIIWNESYFSLHTYRNASGSFRRGTLF